MEKFRDICVYLVIGSALSVLAKVTESTFLDNFYNSSLLEILIVLFSIDVTVVGWNASKIKEFAGDRIHHFLPVTKELRDTLIGQIVVIALTLVLLIVCNSPVCSSVPHSKIIVNSLFGAALAYHIDVLRDTANAIFSLMNVGSGEQPPK